MLGDVGTAEVDINAQGARVTSIDAADGWTVVDQRPRRWARRRPATRVSLYLRRDALHEWEFVVNQLADDSWEAAVVEQWPDLRPGSVVTPGGTVRFRWDNDVLSLAEVVPAAGWDSRGDAEGGESAFVVFSRGTENWEAVVLSDPVSGGHPTVVQRGHNRRVDLGGRFGVPAARCSP